MEFRRTANAGGLLKLDGVTILLDGVSRQVGPYLATPPREKEFLSDSWPDVLAFTHCHKDHYDPDFAALYQKQTNGVVLGPEDTKASVAPVAVDGVSVTPVKSRHIGKAGQTVSHFSFLIEGTKRVLFLGDASPLQWRNTDIPKPDVVFVPYAYAITPSAWQITKNLGADKIVLLHMPDRQNDPDSLWDAVSYVVDTNILTPEMGCNYLL